MAASRGWRMAITVDDLPGIGARSARAGRAGMNSQVLAALQAGGVPAIGFVNEGQLRSEPTLLNDWLDAGMSLGNHTFSHFGLTDTPLDTYKDDILRGEAFTRPLLESRGSALVYFRPPYNQTGTTREIRQALELFLATRSYRIAPYTIEFGDYVFSAVYDAALARGESDLATRTRRQYLLHAETSLDWYRELSRDTFGREIPQVLQVHLNAIHADVLPEILLLLARRGHRFVTLDEVLTDEAYSAPDLYLGREGPSWLHRWRIARGLPDRFGENPPVPADIWERFTLRPRWSSAG